jgi:hypothetical protein
VNPIFSQEIKINEFYVSVPSAGDSASLTSRSSSAYFSVTGIAGVEKVKLVIVSDSRTYEYQFSIEKEQDKYFLSLHGARVQINHYIREYRYEEGSFREISEYTAFFPVQLPGERIQSASLFILKSGEQVSDMSSWSN